MPSRVFFVVLLINLGLLNGEYISTENFAEYVLHSSHMKSETGGDIKNSNSIPQGIVFKWTGHTIGYSQNDPTTIVPAYVASVNYGPHTSSLIYTCIWTSLLPAYSQSHSNFIQGPDGYSCKVTQGKPGQLTEPVDTVVQKPSMSSSTAQPEIQPDSVSESTPSVYPSSNSSVANPNIQQTNTPKTRTARYI